MILSEICHQSCISLELSSRSKADVLREMAELAAKSGKIQSVDSLIDSLLEREAIKTTGVGGGIAIPHATASGVEGLVLALGVSKSGFDFDALDRKPVHLIFLLAGEPRLQTSFLSILSKISRYFRDLDFRGQVLDASSPEEIFTLIQDRENR